MITDLVVYPNPNKEGILYFSRLITGEIYNSNGAVEIKFESSNQIETLNLNQGVYYLKQMKESLEKHY